MRRKRRTFAGAMGLGEREEAAHGDARCFGLTPQSETLQREVITLKTARNGQSMKPLRHARITPSLQFALSTEQFGKGDLSRSPRLSPQRVVAPPIDRAL